jgi:signal transduction histidine kinase
LRNEVDMEAGGPPRLEGVIDDLLTMARVSDPEAGFDPEPVDLRRVVGDVVDECGHTATSRSITIDTSLAGGGVPVPGRPDELHRLLANLLSNALKYSDDGTSVAIELVDADEHVELRVGDRGLGISEEDQRDLFREFYRSTNAEALARPGSGLGLVIVDRIVRRHGGGVVVDSALGRGTTVTVTLPRGPAGTTDVVG